MLQEEKLTERILKCAYEVHTALGPGLFKSIYEEILQYKLQQNGIIAHRQQAIPLVFDHIKFDAGFRADLVVENKVIIEIKSTESLTDIHKAQVLTYLKFSDCNIGLLINFNVVSLKNGIKRYVLQTPDNSASNSF